MDAFGGRGLLFYTLALLAIVVGLAALAFAFYVPILLVAFVVLLMGLAYPLMARKENRDLSVLRQRRQPRGQ